MPGKRLTTEKKELIKSLCYLNPEMSIRDVAKQADANPSTVFYAKAELCEGDGFEQYRTQKKLEHIQRALEIASLYIEHLAEPGVIKDAKARDSAIVAGTMIDKAQLLAGEPTSIIERKEPTPALVAELEEKVEKLKQLTA